MENNELLVSSKASLSVLDLQVAREVVKLHNILLVRNIESTYLIPHFYSINRYIEDKNYEMIRSFIKRELLIIFDFHFTEEKKHIKCSEFQRLSNYKISDKEIIKLQTITGYMNSLTKNIVRHIQDFSEIIKDESEFDNSPNEINTQNGIFNIESRILFPHTPVKLFKNIINANYVKDNDKYPDLFVKFISDSLYSDKLNDVENKKVVRSFLEILSSLLIGNNIHKLFFIIMGKPDTGKSTLIEFLNELFYLYAGTFNNSVMMISSRTKNDIRPDIIANRNKRAMFGSESNKKEKLDDAQIKNLSGNDQVSFRKPHKGEMISFMIKGKFMLITNYCPKFSNIEDQALLNRVILIDFPNKIEKIDKDLKNKLNTPENRDSVFTFLVNIAHEIVLKNDVFIHARFKANKQRILVNQENSVAIFWKEHIRTLEDYCNGACLPKNPVNLIFNVLYLHFCNRLEIEPLAFNDFSKKFKEIADSYPMVIWKRGESNNFYLGLYAVGERADFYNSLITKSIFDPIKIFD